MVNKSISGKYWSAHSYDENFVSELQRYLGIDDFLARIISTRVSSITSAEHFLNPKIKSLLPDPFHLLDMQKAVDRITKAINDNEKLCIFADYDVDGATSAALLKNLFRALGINASIYVPDRITEGYGPSLEAMQKIKSQGTKLVITVDCGSVAFEALEFATSLGLEVIVVDHHISMDNLPNAVAVINPNRLDETSECKNLAAVGVSFLFAIALCKSLKELNFFNRNNLEPPDLMKYLDLVALGTVCDVMQLTGLNRAFVAQGLKVAKNRVNIGYRALSDFANIQEPLNCYHLGFILGPRINAGGRVGRSWLGAHLLSTISEQEALEIATELERYNEERKAIEYTVLEEAMSLAQEQINDPSLFIVGNNWHPGVIGIVAGRLKEKYNKPVAIIALNDGIGKASCRSIKGIDFGCKIIEAKQKGLVVAGGGHAMAAGFTVEEKQIHELGQFLNQKFVKDLQSTDSHLREFYDIDLSTAAATLELLAQIDKLEPFGNGNPAPVFRFSDVYVLRADIVGSKHIKVIFAPTKDSYSSKPLSAIAFNVVGTEIGEVLLSPKSHQLSILGKLKANKWQNKETVQFQLYDIIK
ncbi:MAG: single-stranded-DNA-specific exonuclease RecJ [Rickettsiaceae bacterium]|nr:single-stranded-DNA-specific exonuclease RecJ [Rickettsiaceae bacterium]